MDPLTSDIVFEGDYAFCARVIFDDYARRIRQNAMEEVFDNGITRKHSTTQYNA